LGIAGSWRLDAPAKAEATAVWPLLAAGSIWGANGPPAVPRLVDPDYLDMVAQFLVS
jgi:hypothetical protein